MISDLMKRAQHYEAAGKKPMAARFYRQAAEAASKRYDYDQALTGFDQALKLTPDARVQERFEILLSRQQIYRIQGNNEARITDLDSLEALAQLLDNDEKRANVAVQQAQYNLDQGDYRNAISIVRLAIRLAQLGQAKEVEGWGHLIQGKALSQQGDFDSARIQLNKAEEMAKATTLLPLTAASANALGLLFADLGEYLEATKYYETALNTYHHLEDILGESDVLNNLGIVSHAHGRYIKSKTYWDKAYTAFKQLGNPMGQARTLTNLGAMFMDMGDYVQAKSYHQSTLDLCRELGISFGEALALINLSLVHHYQNDNNAAIDYSRQALNLARNMANRRLEGYALTALAHAELGLTHFQQAHDAYWESRVLWQELDVANHTIEAQAGLAAVALMQNQLDVAQEQVDEIMAYLEDGNSLEGTESVFRIYWICYQVLKANHQTRQADAILSRADAELQERLTEIVDAPLRQSFLENVPSHRAIMGVIQPPATQPETMAPVANGTMPAANERLDTIT